MVVEEVARLKNKIRLYEHVLDCLNVKLFYLQNKRTETEYKENEARLEIIKVSHQIELQKGKLHFINSEFAMKYQLLQEAEEYETLQPLEKPKWIPNPEEIAICLVVNDNTFDTIFCIENLIAKTNAPYKLFIFNLSETLKDYFNIVLPNHANVEVIDCIGVHKASYSLGEIYNRFMTYCNMHFAEYGVFLPPNVIVNDNWLTELRYAYEAFENSGCISIKENTEDLKLSSKLFSDGNEDEMRSVYVNEKNFFKDFLFFDVEKAKEIGSIRTDLKGLELAEWSFRFFASGLSNYYLKYNNVIRLKAADDYLRPMITKEVMNNFTAIANNLLTIEKSS